MMTLLKNVGKGILYIIGLPFFLLVLAGTSLMGVFLLVFMFFKSIILFFTGRSLDDDLPEDIRVKEIKSGKSSSVNTEPISEREEEPVVQPYVAPQNNSSTIEEAVFGHPLYESPIPEKPMIEEPVSEEPVFEEEPIGETPITPNVSVEEEPLSSIDISDDHPEPTEIDIGQYVPHTSGSAFIDEEEEEEESGVTIEYGDDDD